MTQALEGFLQALSAGLLIGAVYGLMCVGLGLIFGVMKVVNFAQGEFVMLAGLIVVTVLGFEGAPLIAAVVVVLLAMIGFGFSLERVVLRPLLGRPVVAVIMATIGVAAVSWLYLERPILTLKDKIAYTPKPATRRPSTNSVSLVIGDH